MAVATAVRASMSVPLYFRALRLDAAGSKADDGDVYVDGGLVMNFPLTLFDSGSVNPRSLGLKLERPEQIPYFKEKNGIAPYNITDLKTYIGALYNLTIETLNRKAPMDEEKPRTIYISTAGMAPKVRRITYEQKTILFESGLRAAQEFFNRKQQTQPGTTSGRK